MKYTVCVKISWNLKYIPVIGELVIAIHTGRGRLTIRLVANINSYGTRPMVNIMLFLIVGSCSHLFI